LQPGPWFLLDFDDLIQRAPKDGEWAFGIAGVLLVDQGSPSFARGSFSNNGCPARGDRALRLSWEEFVRDVLTVCADLETCDTMVFRDLPSAEEAPSLYTPFTVGPWIFWFGDGSEWSGREVVLVRDGMLWAPAPTPEPASLALLAAGVVAAVAFRRRS